MNDEQRTKAIEHQKTMFKLGTVTYERGLDLVEKSGWIGATLIGGMQGMLGVSGGQPTLLVIADVNEWMNDQHIAEIPYHRVVEIDYSPQTS